MTVADKQILVRVSTVEHGEISRLAGEAGQSLSRFIVNRTLGEGVQAPALELAKARAALQAALRALDDVSTQEVEEVVMEVPVPVQEAAAQEPVPEVEEDEPVVYDDGDVYVTVSPPPGAPAWIRSVDRVYTAWRGDRVSMKRLRGAVVSAQSSLITHPGSIFAALIGSKLVVGRAHDGAVVWGETLSWRQADRAATLDALQALATRDLCPSAWDEDEDELEAARPPSANPFDDLDLDLA